MKKLQRFGQLAAATLMVATLGLGSAIAADDLTEAQLKSARAMIKSLGVTNTFDDILPTISNQLKQKLIQASPNYQDLIAATVDEKALALAPRRADLEKEAAAIYAKVFTVEEMDAITAFYTSPAGLKLLKDGPIAIRELGQAGDIWATGISRDMAKQSDDSLEAQISEMEKKAQ